MQYRGSLIPLVFLTAACGADKDFSSSTSQSIFYSANSEIHTLHVAASMLDEWPSDFSWDCPGGGSVMMTTTRRADDSIENLFHTFLGCVVDGRTLDGPLDYLGIESPDCDGSPGFAFDIDGDLDITGPDEGSCVMDAREFCGGASGTACGHVL